MDPFNLHRWLDFLKYSDISSTCLGVNWGLLNAQTIKLIDINLINLYDQRNTLNLAAQFCPDPEVCEFLIAAGVELTHVSASKFNSLHYAAAYNPNPAVLTTLAAAGLELQACAPGDASLAHLAVGSGQYNAAVLAAALQLGVSPNAQDAAGNTALHYACTRRMSNANPFIDTLLAHGADVNISDKFDLTPLDLLIKFHHPMAIIRKFLKFRPKVTPQTLALCEQYYDRNLKNYLAARSSEQN